MKFRYASRIQILFVGGTFCYIFFLLRALMPWESSRKIGITKRGFSYVSGNKRYSYDSNSPIIFIRGISSSEILLLRDMLDAHPQVHCGRETRVIERILNVRNEWFMNRNEDEISEEPDLTEKVIDPATASLILEIMVGNREPATRLCSLVAERDAMEIFPNSKYIFLFPDGRTTEQSSFSTKGFDLYDKIGADRCLRVYHEQLVLHPREQMKLILDFVNLPWSESVIHHEQFIRKTEGPVLSKLESSIDQVTNSTNLKSLDGRN